MGMGCVYGWCFDSFTICTVLIDMTVIYLLFVWAVSMTVFDNILSILTVISMFIMHFSTLVLIVDISLFYVMFIDVVILDMMFVDIMLFYEMFVSCMYVCLS